MKESNQTGHRDMRRQTAALVTDVESASRLAEVSGGAHGGDHEDAICSS